MADRQAEARKLKILMLGDACVGKTSMLMRYDKNNFSNSYIATIGVEFRLKQVEICNEQVTLQIWDTAGEERFRNMCASFYRAGECCILVYDVTNETSFENLTMWKDEFLKHASPSDPEKFPFIVVGNKVDCEDTRQVSYERAQCWCDMNNMCYFETSAKDDINLDKLFHEVARSTLAS